MAEETPSNEADEVFDLQIPIRLTMKKDLSALSKQADKEMDKIYLAEEGKFNIWEFNLGFIFWLLNKRYIPAEFQKDIALKFDKTREEVNRLIAKYEKQYELFENYFLMALVFADSSKIDKGKWTIHAQEEEKDGKITQNSEKVRVLGE